jgi:hypothetical protein
MVSCREKFTDGLDIEQAHGKVFELGRGKVGACFASMPRRGISYQADLSTGTHEGVRNHA